MITKQRDFVRAQGDSYTALTRKTTTGRHKNTGQKTKKITIKDTGCQQRETKRLK